jgi:hypothetical protein
MRYKKTFRNREHSRDLTDCLKEFERRKRIQKMMTEHWTLQPAN